jgi:hypothetical protein
MYYAKEGGKNTQTEITVINRMWYPKEEADSDSVNIVGLIIRRKIP